MKLEEVRDGMRVVDQDGKRLGVVETSKMGDPQAVTSEGQINPAEAPNDHLPSELRLRATGADAALDVPTEQADRLLRFGYIKVKRGHVRRSHFYVALDGIDRVDDDIVYLA